MKCVNSLIIISSGVVVGVDCCRNIYNSALSAAVAQRKKAAYQSKPEYLAC